MARGSLIVVSGPSGVGKGTVLSRAFERDPRIWKSVSATTRDPRAGEVDGVDYIFMSKDDFKEAVNQGGFLEWAEYSGNLYGTPRKVVEEKLDAGKDVVLEIEVQGALQVKEAMPEAHLVFIEPPSVEELERRLRGRGTETEESVRSRMETAKVELSHKLDYDIRLVNDDVETCTRALLDAIEGTHTS